MNPFSRTLASLALLCIISYTISAAEPRILHIAADPNNLPFSNDRGEGFENKIADLIAKELGTTIEYTWRAQRRGFFRETLKQGNVDLVLGVPAGFDMALTTKPYYRSSYVFVFRKDHPVREPSLDSPELRSLRIGIQLVGDDGVNTPPAHALAVRGIVTNVVGFSLLADYSEQNPPARIIEAVADQSIDAALVWGPLASFFASKSQVPLQVAPISPAEDPPLKFAFNIAMGVRKGNTALRDDLNAIIARKEKEISAILDEYHVPRLPILPPPATAGRKD
jgi:mxaJ protein